MSRFRQLLMSSGGSSPTIDYTEVEYAEFDGNTYIDLGYTATEATKVEVWFNAMGNNHMGIFGAEGPAYFYLGIEGGTDLMFGLDTQDKVTSGTYTSLTDWHSLTLDSQYFYRDFDLLYTYTGVTTFDTFENLYIGGINGSVEGLFNGRISVARIYENDVLVHEYVPCYDSIGTVCFYDKIDNQLVYPAQGTLSAGSIISPIEYLDSNISENNKPVIDTLLSAGYFGSVTLTVTSFENSHAVFGSYPTNDSANNAFQLYVSSADYYNARITGLTLSPNTSDFYALNTERVITFDRVHKTLTSDGVVFSQTTGSAYSGNSETLYLFGRHKHSSTVSSTDRFSGRIKNCQIYKRVSSTVVGEILRDYIASVDENGVGYMFDKVSHLLFGNIGTGAFEIPPDAVIPVVPTGPIVDPEEPDEPDVPPEPDVELPL